MSIDDIVFDNALGQVVQDARRHMARDQFDFLGQMGDALMEAEDCCQDRLLEKSRAEEYRDAMIDLAAMALAQAALAGKQL